MFIKQKLFLTKKSQKNVDQKYFFGTTYLVFIYFHL